MIQRPPFEENPAFWVNFLKAFVQDPATCGSIRPCFGFDVALVGVDEEFAGTVVDYVELMHVGQPLTPLIGDFLDGSVRSVEDDVRSGLEPVSRHVFQQDEREMGPVVYYGDFEVEYGAVREEVGSAPNQFLGSVSLRDGNQTDLPLRTPFPS